MKYSTSSIVERCCDWWRMISLVVLVVGCCCCSTAIASTTGASADDLEYLETFGYLNESETSLRDDETVRHAIREFQRLYSLSVTGNIDRPTRDLMERGRCAEPDSSMIADIVENHNGLLPINDLTYFAQPMSADAVKLVRDAFAFWQRETHFTFRPAERLSRADITMSFEEPQHDRDTRVGGRLRRTRCQPLNRALAHASYPQPNEFSVIHANMLANWRKNDFWKTMVHEIGHVLGLPHSSDRSSIMFPMNLDTPRPRHLSPTDRRAILNAYPEWGRPRVSPDQRPAAAMPPNTDFRVVGSIVLGDGETNELFVFSNDSVWTTKNTERRRISDVFVVSRPGAKSIERVQSATLTIDHRAVLITADSYEIFDHKLNHIESQPLPGDPFTGPLLGYQQYIVVGLQPPTQIVRYEWTFPAGSRVLGRTALEHKIADLRGMDDETFDRVYLFPDENGAPSSSSGCPGRALIAATIGVAMFRARLFG